MDTFDTNKLYYYNTKNRKKEKTLTAFMIFIIIMLVATVFFNLVFAFIRIEGSSMENTFFSKDVAFVNKLKNPERGDVVIIDGKKYEYSNGNKVYYLIIKRVIAIEGDMLYFQGGDVYLKKAGETSYSVLQEDYIKEKHKTFYPRVDFAADCMKSEEILVGKGEYYFLGDNRMDSRDSRSDFGTCERSQIQGVVSSRSIKNRQSIKEFYDFSEKIYAFFYRIFE